MNVQKALINSQSSFLKLMLIPDALTDMLQALRLQNVHTGNFQFRSPWGVHFPNDNAQEVAYHIVMTGKCWLLLDNQAIALETGDLVILLKRREHIICDDLCSPVVGLFDILKIEPNHGYKQISYGGEGRATQLLSGCFEFLGNRTHNPLLLALPPLLHIKNDQALLIPWLEKTLEFMTSEIAFGQLGSQTVVARLVDVFFIQAVRAYVAGLQEEQENWLSALIDHQIGIALSLIHRYPEKLWTVTNLAQNIPMSRSAFSARFNQLVGQPPIQYLKTWRMVKGANLLKQTQLSISEVATQVGYQSEVSFSKAFKRWNGSAPSIYRRLNDLSSE